MYVGFFLERCAKKNTNDVKKKKGPAREKAGPGCNLNEKGNLR